MNDENKRLKIFGITSNPWLRNIRSFLCALRPANLSMWSFSLFLSFTATLSITVTPSNKTCPASTIKPQVSSILAHPRRVRDDYARTNCWPSYTTEWHSTLTHGSTFVLQYHPLSFPDHLMYLALGETICHSRANDCLALILCTRKELGTYVLVSSPVFAERQGGCFRMLQCCNLFVGTRMHSESRNKSLQQGNVSSSAMVNCT